MSSVEYNGVYGHKYGGKYALVTFISIVGGKVEERIWRRKIMSGQTFRIVHVKDTKNYKQFGTSEAQKEVAEGNGVASYFGALGIPSYHAPLKGGEFSGADTLYVTVSTEAPDDFVDPTVVQAKAKKNSKTKK